MDLNNIDFTNTDHLSKLGMYWEKSPIDWVPKRFVLFNRKLNKYDFIIIDSNKSYIGYPLKDIHKIPDDVCLVVRENVLINKELPILRVKKMNGFIDLVMSDKRGTYNGRIITITGSVGKTSTTRLVDNSLKLFGTTHLSIRDNLRNGIYGKLTSLREEEFSIYEVAAGALNSVPKVLKSNVAVLLTIGEAHLERFASLEDLALHKAKIFEGAKLGDKAVISTDLDYFEMLYQKAVENKRDVITYGVDNRAIFRMTSFNETILEFMFNDKMFSIDLNISERYLAMNFLANLSILEALGVCWQEKIKELSQLIELEPGRGDEHNLRIGNADVTIIDSAFNSSPLALSSVLKSFNQRKVKNGNKIAVLSDMLELGDTTSALHQRIVNNFSDYNDIACFVLVGNEMIKVVSDDERIKKFMKIDESFDFLKENLNNGDIVLFKGSHGTRLRDKLWENFSK